MPFVRRMLMLCCCALCCLSSCARATTEAAPPAPGSALFINVGRADAALFFLANGAYLVDTGSSDSYDALARALETYHVTRLRAVFVTHTDKDHVGGLKKLLKSDVTVEQVYAPAFFCDTTEEKHPARKQAEKRSVPFAWLSAGDVVQAGEGTSFTVLGPLRRDEYDEDNNSLVLLLKTPEGDMLLAADMKQSAEIDLLAANAVPQAAVLKVGRHGKDDASSYAFLNAVRPQLAIISTNTVEDGKTASWKVLALLERVGALTALTQDASCGVLVTLSGGTASAQAADYTP